MDIDLKKSLKMQAHSLKPVILFGAKGLTEALIAETANALAYHELIKVKLTGIEKEDRAQTVQLLCEKTQSELVQSIGNIAILYKENQNKPKKM